MTDGSKLERNADVHHCYVRTILALSIVLSVIKILISRVGERLSPATKAGFGFGFGFGFSPDRKNRRRNCIHIALTLFFYLFWWADVKSVFCSVVVTPRLRQTNDLTCRVSFVA